MLHWEAVMSASRVYASPMLLANGTQTPMQLQASWHATGCYDTPFGG